MKPAPWSALSLSLGIVFGIVLGFFVSSMQASQHQYSLTTGLEEPAIVEGNSNVLPAPTVSLQGNSRMPVQTGTGSAESGTSKSDDRPLDYLHRPEDAVVFPSDAQLELRYGNLTSTELKGAQTVVGSILKKRAHGLLDAKLDRGEYQSRIVEPGESIPEEGEFPDGTSRITKSVWKPISGGLLEYRVAEMSSVEDPLIEGLYGELSWINGRIFQLNQEEKSDE